jgi:hypothetical protein
MNKLHRTLNLTLISVIKRRRLKPMLTGQTTQKRINMMGFRNSTVRD